MNSLNQDSWNHSFSHIYIETKILDSPKVIEIRKQFPNAVIIPIQHYKDVFNRNDQNFHMQSLQRKLILASNTGQLVFKGAPVCQSFGQEYFYYTSNILNCIYDCEYCYLQGMYPSANLVVFVNLEDNFAQLDTLLRDHPVYVCISYDTDLLALEHTFHFISEWIAYAKQHSNLTIEIRTKSAQSEIIRHLESLPNIIYAWTLSPDEVWQQYEHKTPPLRQRLTALTTAIECGHPVRICFDPMLDIPHAETIYHKFIDEVFHVIHEDTIKDVSLGLFRISKEYLKQLRKHRPNSSVAAYPYVQSNGYCHYDDSVYYDLLMPIYHHLSTYIPAERIFLDTSAIITPDNLS